MEAHAEESCRVVYFCPRRGDLEHVHELHHQQSPPRTDDGESSSSSAAAVGGDTVAGASAAETAHAAGAASIPAMSGAHNLGRIRTDVRMLLDEDVGGFADVFVGSRVEDCVARIESCANAAPVVVLVEFNNPVSQGAISTGFLKDEDGSYAFLRGLAADVQGARYQKHVMPFAVLTGDVDKELDHTITCSCLDAGALDIIRSPFSLEDIHRVLGHVKKLIRPPARLLGAPMAQNLVDSIYNVSEPTPSAHRPDLSLSAVRKLAVEQAVCRWHFPAQAFDMDELTYAALYMLEHLLTVPELAPYGLSRPRLMTFLLATRRQYKHYSEVHYHNWRHAVDVTQTVFYFLLGVRLCPPLEADIRPARELNPVESVLTHLDALILLVSAIGHDVGHPGVNNAFLVACNHPLAQMYNDKSVLENYHCAAYSQLLRRHWPSLSSITGFRSTMISNILATDMQRHFEYMSRLGDFKQKVRDSDEAVCAWPDKEKESTRELLMSLLLKAADISNVARPFDVSSNWAKILMNEFARQGELESELQIPTCLFGGPPDREDVLAAAESQKGFMSLFGLPLFQGLADIMPSVSCAVKELGKNQKLWDERAENEKRRREEGLDDTPDTISSVTPEEVEEAWGKHKSEPMIIPSNPSSTSPSSARHARAPMFSRRDQSPSLRNAVHDHSRRPLSVNVASDDGGIKRASTPLLGFGGVPPLSPLILDSSRRSSKDIALDQLQQLTAYAAHQSSNAGSRRGSADFHIHQSYPSSRRGSKDESLTTILVTSGGGGGGGGPPPASAQRTPRTSPPKNVGPTRHHPQNIANAPPSPSTTTAKDRSSIPARASAPSSRSNTTSTAMTNPTTLPSPSTTTQNSSLLTADDEDDNDGSGQPSSNSASEESESSPRDRDRGEAEAAAAATASAATVSETLPPPPASLPRGHHTIASTEDPFTASRTWPNDPADGIRRTASIPAGMAAEGLPASPPLPPPNAAAAAGTTASTSSTSSSSTSPKINVKAGGRNVKSNSEPLAGTAAMTGTASRFPTAQPSPGADSSSLGKNELLDGSGDFASRGFLDEDERGGAAAGRDRRRRSEGKIPGIGGGGAGGSAGAGFGGSAAERSAALRGSRSRSRLRGLRFWRKKGEGIN